ncbi:MAG: Lrp/AsnC ligand binding domain-containing protein, partial [Thaumarchaeota archaeon]|nr:Lrp/AsnC ligand binding domain-containing protein [Nitrososphaerota archaeon]
TCLAESSTAYLMVNCQNGQEHTVRDKLRGMRYVSDVLDTCGNYDIVAKIEPPTLEELRDTISRIRRIKDIRCTTTLICLSN